MRPRTVWDHQSARVTWLCTVCVTAGKNSGSKIRFQTSFSSFSLLMLSRRVFTIGHGNYRVLTVDSGTRFLLGSHLTLVTMQFRLDGPGLGTCWSETPFPARSVAALRRLSVLTHYTHLAAGQRSHSLGVCFSVLKREVQLIIDVKLCEKCSIKSSRRSII